MVFFSGGFAPLPGFSHFLGTTPPLSLLCCVCFRGDYLRFFRSIATPSLRLALLPRSGWPGPWLLQGWLFLPLVPFGVCRECCFGPFRLLAPGLGFGWCLILSWASPVVTPSPFCYCWLFGCLPHRTGTDIAYQRDFDFGFANAVLFRNWSYATDFSARKHGEC